VAKAAFNRKKTIFTSKLHYNLKNKPVKFYIWSVASWGAETWTLRKVYHKYLENFEMCCWRRMETISCTDRLENEEVMHRVKERNMVHKIKRRKADCIGHILRRNCLLKHVIEDNIAGRVEVTGRRGKRCKQPLDDLKEKRRYCKLKEEALDRSLWRTGF
jgi:hypothetical protein